MEKSAARILLVDDETDILDLMEAALKPVFGEVVKAQDGKQALEAHKQKPADVIVTDLKMPVMGGVPLLKTLREQGDLTPVIVLTAYGDLNVSIQCLRLGAFDFFVKPFSARDMVARVREAVEMRGLMRLAENDVQAQIQSGELPAGISEDVLNAARQLALLKRHNSSKRARD